MRAILIAGPEGAGKTTFAHDFLLPAYANIPHFTNADLIADGLAPFAPETTMAPARRVMRQELRRHVSAHHDFAVETTLSTREWLPAIARWRAVGYRVTAIFLQLDSPEQAIARVAWRFLAGGRTVPDQTIRRGFNAGWKNFATLYAPAVDAWAVYDNAGVRPVLLDCSEECPEDPDLRLATPALRQAARRVQEMAELTGTPIVISRNGVLEQMTAGFDRAVPSVHEPRRAYIDA